MLPCVRVRLLLSLVVGLSGWLVLGGGGRVPTAMAGGEPVCPGPQVLCDASVQLLGWLTTGDVNAVVAHSQPIDLTCTRSDILGAGPGSACYGAVEGEHRTGYLWGGGGQYAVGGYVRDDAWPSIVSQVVEALDTAGTGGNGLPAVQLLGFAIGSPDQPLAPFIAFLATVTNPEDGSLQQVLFIFPMQVDEASGSFAIQGAVVVELPAGVAPIGPQGLTAPGFFTAPDFVTWPPAPR